MVNSGELIETIRTQKGITLEALAKGTYTVDYLNRIEQGKAELSTELSEYLSEKFGVGTLHEYIDESTKMDRLMNLLSEYKNSGQLNEKDLIYLEINAELPQTVKASLIIYSLLIRYTIKNDPAKAVKYYELSLKTISDDLRDKDNESLFGYYYLTCGNHFYYKQNFLYADKYYSKAIELEIKGIDLANAYYNLSLTKQRLFHNNTCIIYSKKAAIMYEDLGEELFLYQTYVTIGIQSYNLENYEAALQNLNAALSFMKKYDDKRTTAQIYYNLGHTYHKLKQYQKSINQYLQSLEISEEIEDHKNSLYVLRNLSLLFLDIKNIEKAKLYLDLSRKALKNAYHKYIDLELKAIEAKINLLKGKEDSYVQSITQIIEDSNNENYYKLVERYASELGEYYFSKKHYEEASKLLLIVIETQNKLWRRNMS